MFGGKDIHVFDYRALIDPAVGSQQFTGKCILLSFSEIGRTLNSKNHLTPSILEKWISNLKNCLANFFIP